MQFQNQIYQRDECITFLKTAEQFGGLSNMAGGYPLLINDVSILTSEALYQACRFPHKPEVQRIVIAQKSPMTAKMKSKPYRKDSRPDWDEIRISVMWWCLRVKLAQHWEKFGNLLLSTNDKPIVEISHRDQFWGAKPVTSENLDGVNILGKLLTRLREYLKSSRAEGLKTVSPLALPQFLLMGAPIGAIEAKNQETTLNNAILLDQPVMGELALSGEADIRDNNEYIAQQITPLFVAKQLDSPDMESRMLIQLTFDYLSS